MLKHKIVVLFSGGLDSTVLLMHCREAYDEVIALNISYGAKHNRKERQAARAITQELNIVYCEYNLLTNCTIHSGKRSRVFSHESFLKSDLLESGGKIPEGHYEDESMKATIVPFRNGIMLSLAIGFARGRDIRVIGFGGHSGDHAIYFDCRPEFIGAMREAALQGTGDRMGIHTPFIRQPKHAIVTLGKELHVPFELTWTCYKGNEWHCGRCGACVERKEAFKLAGIDDPVRYTDA